MSDNKPEMPAVLVKFGEELDTAWSTLRNSLGNLCGC